MPEIPIWFSLTFIGASIAVATIASLLKTRNDRSKSERSTVQGEPIETAADAADATGSTSAAGPADADANTSPRSSTNS